MGAVYRAIDTKLNREVAIKVLPEASANAPDYLARFTREAQVLASLKHPNIAIIHGVEEQALVMELVRGRRWKSASPPAPSRWRRRSTSPGRCRRSGSCPRKKRDPSRSQAMPPAIHHEHVHTPRHDERRFPQQFPICSQYHPIGFAAPHSDGSSSRREPGGYSAKW
jgi:hypothetical protein